jgi:hypothetical protein
MDVWKNWGYVWCEYLGIKDGLLEDLHFVRCFFPLQAIRIFQLAMFDCQRATSYEDV